jgi:multisubunit Na+/H+ antiporter MnhF subunit
VLHEVDGEQIEAAILAFQRQVRGPAPKDEVVAMDGKAARRSRGQQVLTVVAVPSQYYLGSAPVPVDKTDEIPVARALIRRLDLEGRLVGLDALHTQTETACDLLQEATNAWMPPPTKTSAACATATPSGFSVCSATLPPACSSNGAPATPSATARP